MFTRRFSEQKCTVADFFSEYRDACDRYTGRRGGVAEPGHVRERQAGAGVRAAAGRRAAPAVKIDI